MTNAPISRFPAILICGSSHIDSSVLAHNLRKALNRAKVQSYLLKAGSDTIAYDFKTIDTRTQDSRPEGTSAIPTWVTHIRRDLAYRPLPFLVDVGDLPLSWAEALFDQCTHAILLTRDAKSQAYWKKIAEKYTLIVIADLTLIEGGNSWLEVTEPHLIGSVANLEIGSNPSRPVFETLLKRIKEEVFNYDYEELLNIHQIHSPTDLVVDLPRLYRRINPNKLEVDWQPNDLETVLRDLPNDTPLALYGAGPAWLYTAIANYIFPVEFFQFDVRRGWVQPVEIAVNSTSEPLITVMVEELEEFLHLRLILSQPFLEYQPTVPIPLPPVPSNRGVVLSGRLPYWLFTGLTRYYYSASWVATYSPYLNQVVIVSSQQSDGQYKIGNTINVPDDFVRAVR